MGIKTIHIGKLINKLRLRKKISIEQVYDFLKCKEGDVYKMLAQRSMDTEKLLAWSKLLKYDFFKIYSHHLISSVPEILGEYPDKETGILGETADIQKAFMKQFESKVRKEEQERISQNLHDDLAGTLAAIKNNIDIQIVETEEHQRKEKLLQLSEMITVVFNKVRDKSHELFETAQLPDEEMFYQHISHMAQIMFPDKQYKLNIQIDEYALVNISIGLRSELISVIQEAFTNIVKHAEATRVDLLIYNEVGKLFIIIKDDGKGLKIKSDKNTLGITNMKKRLKKFNADFLLLNDGKGLEINISIPETREAT